MCCIWSSIYMLILLYSLFPLYSLQNAVLISLRLRNILFYKRLEWWFLVCWLVSDETCMNQHGKTREERSWYRCWCFVDVLPLRLHAVRLTPGCIGRAFRVCIADSYQGWNKHLHIMSQIIVIYWNNYWKNCDIIISKSRPYWFPVGFSSYFHTVWS